MTKVLVCKHSPYFLQTKNGSFNLYHIPWCRSCLCLSFSWWNKHLHIYPILRKQRVNLWHPSMHCFQGDSLTQAGLHCSHWAWRKPLPLTALGLAQPLSPTMCCMPDLQDLGPGPKTKSPSPLPSPHKTQTDPKTQNSYPDPKPQNQILKPHHSPTPWMQEPILALQVQGRGAVQTDPFQPTGRWLTNPRLGQVQPAI